MILLVCIWNLVPVVGIIDILVNITLATPTEVVFTYKMFDFETDGDIYWFITAEDNINSGGTIRNLALVESRCAGTSNQVDEDLHVEEVACEQTFGSFYFLYTALDYDGQGLDVFVASKVPFVVGTYTPTSMPILSPTDSPTSSPSQSPTNSPTSSTISSPTNPPTSSPTLSPTQSSTEEPTLSPIMEPATEEISGEIETRNLWIWFVGIITSTVVLILGLVVSEFYCPAGTKRL